VIRRRRGRRRYIGFFVESEVVFSICVHLRHLRIRESYGNPQMTQIVLLEEQVPSEFLPGEQARERI
jgi:hypothetical protein